MVSFFQPSFYHWFHEFIVFYRLKNPTAKSSGTSSPTPAPSASSASAAKSTAAVDTAGEPAYKNTVKYTFFILNLGMMVFLAATGVLGIQQSSGVDDTSVVFVGIYLILFAAIVFLYEVAQMCPESSIDIFFKKNFGFLYGVIGKSLFILL